MLQKTASITIFCHLIHLFVSMSILHELISFIWQNFLLQKVIDLPIGNMINTSSHNVRGINTTINILFQNVNKMNTNIFLKSFDSEFYIWDFTETWLTNEAEAVSEGVMFLLLYEVYWLVIIYILWNFYLFSFNFIIYTCFYTPYALAHIHSGANTLRPNYYLIALEEFIIL